MRVKGKRMEKKKIKYNTKSERNYHAHTMIMNCEQQTDSIKLIQVLSVHKLFPSSLKLFIIFCCCFLSLSVYESVYPCCIIFITVQFNPFVSHFCILFNFRNTHTHTDTYPDKCVEITKIVFFSRLSIFSRI